MPPRSRPARRSRSISAPIPEGQVIKVFWRGKPIFISHRTKKEIDEARARQCREPARPAAGFGKRVKDGHDQWLVLIGICTHLGCIPLAHQGDYDGWFCPCHGSQYDIVGPHPAGAGAAQSRSAALRVRLRHQDPDRLTAVTTFIARFHHERTFDLPAAEAHSCSGSSGGCRSAA